MSVRAGTHVELDVAGSPLQLPLTMLWLKDLTAALCGNVSP